MGMEAARGVVGFGLSIRQTFDQVAAGQQCTLNAPSDIQRDCASTDFTCLCGQAEPNTFVDWFLSTVCDTCDGVQKLNVDPVSELATYCSVQAAATKGAFNCAFFTTASVATTMAVPTTSTLSVVVPSVATPTSDPTPVTSNTIFNPQPTQESQTTSIGSTSVTEQSPSNTDQFTASSTSSLAPLSSILGDLTTTTSSQIPSLFPVSSGSVSSSTSSPTPSGVLISSQSTSKHTLSTGAKAGIGIAAGLTPLLLFLLLLLCYRRRKSRSRNSSTTGREILPSYSPPNNEKFTPNTQHDADYSGVREIFIDSTDISPTEDNVRRSRIGMAMSPEPGNYPGDRASRIGLAVSPEPGARGSVISSPKRFSVPRKEVASYITHALTSQPRRPSYDAYSSRESHVVRDSVVASSQAGRDSYLGHPSSTRDGESYLSPERREGRDSQMSGILTGPMQDMWVYGGEVIETDEELARLEEEERRIDEAIRETERLGRMREEREAVRRRIAEVRKSVGGRE